MLSGIPGHGRLITWTKPDINGSTNNPDSGKATKPQTLKASHSKDKKTEACLNCMSLKPKLKNEEQTSILHTTNHPTLNATAASRLIPPLRKNSVELRSNAILINGKPRLIRGGTIQWFRLPEADWQNMVKRVKAAGFNAIDMYVPWRDIQPRDPKQFPNNSFDHGMLDQMVRFIKLAKSEGMYIYFRPGPYICDEFDGGGIPSWIRTKNEKNVELKKPGQVTMRTADPNWINHCKHYLDAVNDRIRPFLATRGGPIIFYAIENEYDYFEQLYDLEKRFYDKDIPERAHNTKIDTRQYIKSLRNIVRHQGIDVPVTTCPGRPGIAGTADLPGIVPWPNNYQMDQFFRTSLAISEEMHDPNKHQGVYTNYPLGYTETPPRNTALMKSAVMAGAKAFFPFNLTGFYQDGYRNTIILNPAALGLKFNGMSPIAPIKKFFEIAYDRKDTFFFAPPLGYMNSYMDFYGPVGAQGVNRLKFQNYRRANMFINSFEKELATLPRSDYSINNSRSAKTAPVELMNSKIGEKGRDGLATFFYQAKPGNYFISLLNNTGQTQIIRRNQLRVENETFPKYTDLTIPTEPYPGHPRDKEELCYNQILVTGIPLSPAARIKYCTSEILSRRQLNREKVLVVYGEPNTRGELVLDNLDSKVTLVSRDPNFHIHENNADSFAVSYTHEPNRLLSLKTSDGTTLKLFVTTRGEAGKIWFLKDQNQDLMLTGLDYLETRSSWGKLDLKYDYQTRQKIIPITSLSQKPITLSGFSTSENFDPKTGLMRHIKVVSNPYPQTNPQLLKSGNIYTDTTEADPGFDDTGWITHQGEPPALETKQIHEGHAWYRTEIDLTEKDLNQADDLYIEHVSDFAGIYINGNYVTTVAPVGAAIDTKSPNPRFHINDLKNYFHPGKNTLSFRTEIWGHGAFGGPTGKFLGVIPSLPGVSLEGLKGLWGEARLGNKPLTQWKIRAGLGMETNKLIPKSNPIPAKIPLTLKKGQIAWYETRFHTSDLPDPEHYNAPVVLNLKGTNTKATIYLNGKLIGRWLSDDNWLKQGTWSEPTREMWSFSNPNHTPISIRTLQPNKMNTLKIAFEDTSSNDKSSKNNAPGHISDVSLKLNQEDLIQTGNSTVRAPLISCIDKTSLSSPGST